MVIAKLSSLKEYETERAPFVSKIFVPNQCILMDFKELENFCVEYNLPLFRLRDVIYVKTALEPEKRVIYYTRWKDVWIAALVKEEEG